jgi:uncharacterized membrane protein
MNPKEKPSKETLEQLSKDPDNWIWGIFYYNPKDKRILPPKRIEWMGYTVNFANTKSVLFFIGMLLFFVFVALFITLRNKH